MYRRLIEQGELTEAEATALLGKSPWEAQGKVPAVWATPQARDYRTGQAKRWDNPERSRNLNDQAAKSEGGGQLNPRWVEWLMGYPSNYTYLED